MKRVLFIFAAAIIPVLAAATVVSFAQQQQGDIVVKQRVVHGQDGVPPPPADFGFVITEMGFGGKVVKGAPYSAQAVTETVQTLSDGNRIINKSTSVQYRDGEGRTRREQSIKMLGALGDSGEPFQTIFINDPVAGVSYTLDTRSKTARKTMPFKLSQKLPAGGPQWTPMPGDVNQRFEFKVQGPAGNGDVVKVVPPGATTVGPVAPGEPGQTFSIHTDTVGMAYVFRRTGAGDNNVKEEQLGKQSFDGVEADGTRTTITIPAGEIGNERPIEIVSERWYSPELQMVVMTRHSDPRTGETTYRLTDINRSEPAKTMFEVPADFTVKEGMPGPPDVINLPAKVRRPE